MSQENSTPSSKGAAKYCDLDDIEDNEKAWYHYKIIFNKKYADEAEEAMRKQIFVGNKQKIENQNKRAQEGKIWYAKLNRTSDMTKDEIATLYGPSRIGISGFDYMKQRQREVREKYPDAKFVFPTLKRDEK